MSTEPKREVWLRGPLPGVLPALQPVAHALLQAKEEVNELLAKFPDGLLWQRPASVASVGFHLQHMSGVLDRLFTYAKGEMLSPQQLQALAAEGQATQEASSVGALLQSFNERVDTVLVEIRNASAETIFETRFVGRNQLPSTMFGLMVHAAEHTMRHLGQLLVTVKVLTWQS